MQLCLGGRPGPGVPFQVMTKWQQWSLLGEGHLEPVPHREAPDEMLWPWVSVRRAVRDARPSSPSPTPTAAGCGLLWEQGPLGAGSKGLECALPPPAACHKGWCPVWRCSHSSVSVAGPSGAQGIVTGMAPEL